MAINWRQRAPILRVLAAVYAELGEEAFKGRYGRIAKLYGTEATYDAIKSFFAKEIVKMAEELKLRNSDGGDERNGIRHRHRSTTIQRPLHLSFDENDDDVMIMSEREVHLEESSQPTVPLTKQKARYESVDDGYDFDRPVACTNGFRAINASHLPSVTPGPSSRTARPNQVSPEMQAPSRKRPHSVLEDPDELPPSFGYVTNRGQHRCALCMTELPDAEILRKHELASKLHLANLKDPVVVSRGCITLAQVTSLAEPAPRQRHRPNSASLRVGGFDGRAASTAAQRSEQRGQSSTPFGRSISIVSDDENNDTLDTIHVAQPRDASTKQHQPQTNGHTENHDSENGPTPDFEGFQNTTKDKGKTRAQTVPRDLAAAAGLRPLPNIDEEVSVQQPGLAIGSSSLKRSAGEIVPEDIQPTLLAQLLLSSGMELLAKKCIEEHPELRVGFYKCIQEMQGSGGVDAVDRRKRARQEVIE